MEAIFFPLRFGLWLGLARPWTLELPTDGGVEWGSYSCDPGGWMETTTWHLAQNISKCWKMASHACWTEEKAALFFFGWLLCSLGLFRTFFTRCPAKDELIDWKKISLLRSEQMACDPAALIETGPSLVDGPGGLRWDGYNICSLKLKYETIGSRSNILNQSKSWSLAGGWYRGEGITCTAVLSFQAWRFYSQIGMYHPTFGRRLKMLGLFQLYMNLFFGCSSSSIV